MPESDTPSAVSADTFNFTRLGQANLPNYYSINSLFFELKNSMENRIFIEVSVLEDVFKLAPYLRKDDIQEANALNLTAEQALLRGFVYSEECYSVKYRGEIIGMFGVSEYDMSQLKEIDSDFMSDTIQEVDELCTHYLIDYVDIGDIQFINENSTILLDISKPFDIEVTGQIEVEHQFGSDGDYKRGDGLRYNANYPYSIKLKINIPSIKEFIDDEEEYDNLKNYTQKEKNELNGYFIDEFYRNIQIIDYDIDTSKHFE